MGYYCNQKRCGLWEYFDNKGNIISQENYTNGMLDGDLINFVDGVMVESFEYVEDKKNGIALTFYATGSVKNLTYYIDDELEGEFSLFDKTGILIESGFYSQGFREGEWILYQNNKVHSTFYKNGQLINEK